MTMKKIHPTLFLLSTLLLASWADIRAEEPSIFQSSEKRAQVIELYTSQGCSSCPPAERWLNQFVDDPGLWTEFVPVTFHVSYWDRLGWKDPFANKQYTARQYAYSERGAVRNVYTPSFVSNGKEWRGWFQRDPLPQVTGSAGILKGVINNNRLDVEYTETTALTLNVATLGFDLTTDIRSGENWGKRLEQQFVVLHHQTADSKNGRWSLKLPDLDQHRAKRLGLAVWVSRKGDLEPIQAMGTWLNKSLY